MHRLSLNCWVVDDGPDEIFAIKIRKTDSVGYLKEKIMKKNRNSFDYFDSKQLELWRVSLPLDDLDTISSLKLENYTKLSPAIRLLSEFFEEAVSGVLHIVVKPPDERASKRARLDAPPPAKESPRISSADMQASIALAFEPFKQFVELLATGELDGYLDSVHRTDKLDVPGLIMSTDPHLLLHDLDKYVDQERVRGLFRSGTTQLFENSGAGKTRLLFEGLCSHWGFYISCSTKGKGPVSGSRDFETAVETLKSMGTWDRNNDAEGIQKNQEAAQRVFAMLMYTRAFILDQFVSCVPPQTDVRMARRRWVLLQAMPPCLLDLANDPYDIFVKLFLSLRNADTETMMPFIKTTLTAQRKDLFPVPKYFAIIDEVQGAGDNLNDFFRSDTGSVRLIREFYLFLHSSSWAEGIILSGTGLSTGIVENAFRSVSMRDTGQPGIKIFTDTGRFLRNETLQRDYVLRYLSLSVENSSDVRLLERILYWFPGRYRFTASFIELLLKFENAPRHRTLSALVKQTTGFSLTDAIDLEEKEDPIPLDVMDRIRCYGLVGSVNRIINDPTKQGLIQSLMNVVMRWTFGGQSTSLPIENQTHDIIAFGVGHLAKIDPQETIGPYVNYPVYIDEPMIILYLRCLFERWPSTSRKTWITNLLSCAHNKASVGYILEDLVLMVLIEKFGNKFTALGDVFNFSEVQASTLGSKKVRLVSLRQHTDDVMHCCSVSWGAGSSDRIGFKAETPVDVLNFLKNPRGITFLFPDANFGPDMIAIFEDKETHELISATIQSKAQVLNWETWVKALESVTPECFYMNTTQDGEKAGFAPVKYPDLPAQVRKSFEEILGHEVCTPVVGSYRKMLRPQVGNRKTPTFLRIIASPDDDQTTHLAAESKPTATLNWAMVKNYIGSAADIMTTKQRSLLF